MISDIVEGDRGREPGRIWGGRDTGRGRREGGKRDVAGTERKEEKFVTYNRKREKTWNPTEGGGVQE